MLRNLVYSVLTSVVAASMLLGPRVATAAILPEGFQDELVLDGFNQPMSLRFLPDGRILVTERSPGVVKVVAADGSAVIGTAVEIPNVPGDGERGLLSIAIDPQWPVRPYLYAYYNLADGDNTIELSRYRGVGDLNGTSNGALNFGEEVRLISGIPDLCSNHNGGDLRFAPDRTLLLSVGDDENKCAAQELDNVLGRILRMDVSDLPPGAVGLDDLVPADNPYVEGPGSYQKLTWTLGLRNPFRMHVDPANGSVFVADVGWRQREEISHVELGGVNLGWPYEEGSLSIATSVTSCSCWSCNCSVPVNFDPLSPIADYPRSEGRSVISAGIYREPQGARRAWPAEYDGDYFYSDFYEGYLRRLEGSGQTWTLAPPAAGQTDAEFWATGLGIGIVSFEFGPDGSLYYLNLNSGELRRIAYKEVTSIEASSFGALKTRFGPGNDHD